MKEQKEEPKDHDYMEGVEVEITEIEVRPTPMNPEEVQQVRVHTSKGDITYKPKVEKTEHRKGLTIKRKVPCLIDDLPEKLIKMADLIARYGKITVNVAYSTWNTEKDGEAVTYRFIQGAATLEKWVILDTGKPKEERVV